jgi:uncharacterized protein DUF5681
MTVDASLQPLDKKGRPIHPHMWKKGQSGNPKGRPKGCKNKSTRQAQLLAQGMLNSQVVQLVQKLLKMALEGDAKAMKLCIERILPPLKEPMEPTKVQHAIEVVLKEPRWLTAPDTAPGIITIEDIRHDGRVDEQGQG